MSIVFPVRKPMFLQRFCLPLQSSAMLLVFLSAMNSAKAQLVDADDYSSKPVKATNVNTINWKKQGTLPIYFATTRLNEGEKDNPVYGFRRHLDLGDGSVDYGVCRLAYPSAAASLETAKDGRDYKALIKQIGSQWESTKIRSTETYRDEEAFFNVVRGWDGPICVYTHGYDISFDEAVRDLALICAEFESKHPESHVLPVLFTWPSIGTKTEYSADEANLEWSEKPFFEFLDRLFKEKSPSATLDLVAHSMGCRPVFRYCQKTPTAITSANVRNIFLCSADVDFHYAEQHKKELQDSVSNFVYVLVSDKDGPLIMSEYLHGQPRLGRPLDPPKFTRQRSELIQTDYWAQVAGDALDLMRRNGMNDNPEVQQWLASNPELAQDYGPKARLVDVTEVMSESVGHALAWPVVAGLMAEPPSLKPLPTSIVYKKPDRAWLQRCNGKPFRLYKFVKVDLYRLNR
ncbi:MAG: alpha/beta hydrolase [Candidatus Obscuribacterales bacterium]|nr:alpha/beta hydrolase [Candidatus Obscuribacterales bacterium]